jgi:hypothetical protein
MVPNRRENKLIKKSDMLLLAEKNWMISLARSLIAYVWYLHSKKKELEIKRGTVEDFDSG